MTTPTHNPDTARAPGAGALAGQPDPPPAPDDAPPPAPTPPPPQADRSATDPPPVLQLAADVYAALQHRAVPLEDDINSVLRRVLGLTPDRHPRPGRAARAATGSILPLRDYAIPILRALADLGGWAPTREVIAHVGTHLDTALTAIDHQPLATGRIRWHERTHHTRLRLIDQGHLRPDSPRGIWEITPTGREHLAHHDRCIATHTTTTPAAAKR